MSEEEYISKINKLVSDLETVRDRHKFEAASYSDSQMPHLYQRLQNMHESKAAAYDFVVRKLKRTFNLINNGK